LTRKTEALNSASLASGRDQLERECSSEYSLDTECRGDYIAASAVYRALNGRAGQPVRTVFEIVDLERETQAAVS